MDVLLEGLRRDEWDGDRVPSVLASKLADRGAVLYRVSIKDKKIDPTPSGGREKRAAARQRTRLRSGKLLDAENRFISECTIVDRSKNGWRVKLARNLGAPPSCRIYDDETGEIAVGAVVWRKDALLGVRKIRVLDPTDVAPVVRNLLGRKYYAVGA